MKTKAHKLRVHKGIIKIPKHWVMEKGSEVHYRYKMKRRHWLVNWFLSFFVLRG